jgi:hypothetical protein
MTHPPIPSEPMPESPIEDTSDMLNDRVKKREILLVGLGAGLIVAFALYELANQFFSKIKNPEQAESIVDQVVKYEMPGGSQGLKSFKTNTEAFALVGNRQNPPNLLLLVSQAPIEPTATNDAPNLAEELDIPSALVGSWRSAKTTTESRQFCGQTVPVTIRQGNYRLLESPGQMVKMREYLIVYPQKTMQTSIQLFAIGPEAAQQIDTVFQSFQCPTTQSQL